MRIYTLYKAFTTTTNAGATLNIVGKCRIKAVVFAVNGALNGDTEAFAVELGLVPTAQCTTNDSQGCIAVVRQMSGFITSGLNAAGVNLFVPMDLAVGAGDKMYLHCVMSGDNVVANVSIYTDEV